MKIHLSLILFTSLSLLSVSSPTNAGEADVVGVTVDRHADGSCRFDVTVSHKDEGWKHYADKWDVVDTHGIVLGTRVLFHPHVDEQPFTRSLSGVAIPADVTRVIIRAHDSVHKYGGRTAAVSVPAHPNETSVSK